VKAFKRAKDKLLKIEKIAAEDNHYWLKAS